jgi:hypothetical protein
MAANCAAFAGTPGGAGGSTCCAIPSNRAPGSKPFWGKIQSIHNKYIDHNIGVLTYFHVTKTQGAKSQKNTIKGSGVSAVILKTHNLLP